MVEAQTWRELLGRIIQDTHEKQRIAGELGINPITLVRWASGTGVPRIDNLRGLLNVLPEYTEQLRALLSEEYSNFIMGEETATDSPPEAFSEIPSAFFGRVLHAYSANPTSLRSSIIMDLVLQQALSHLDPDVRGMKIVLACCVPPDEQASKVRSLREVAGYGTPPWSKYSEYQGVLLGVESLSGYATMSGHRIIINNPFELKSMFPLYADANENSVVAFPIIAVDRVAGCITITSTQPNYFIPARLDLIQNYTQLLLLAFDQAAFYPLNMLELGVMPPAEIQRPILQSFHHRVAEVMLKSARKHQSIDRQRAEKIVWSQLEKELLEKSLDLANNN